MPLHSLAYGSVPLPDPDWVKNVDGNAGWIHSWYGGSSGQAEPSTWT